jgi:hypothetical protein
VLSLALALWHGPEALPFEGEEAKRGRDAKVAWHPEDKSVKGRLPEKITHLIIIHLLSCDQKDHASCLNKSYY